MQMWDSSILSSMYSTYVLIIDKMVVIEQVCAHKNNVLINTFILVYQN